MTSRTCAGLFAMLVILTCNIGCGRADVYAITSESAGGGSTGGSNAGGGNAGSGNALGGSAGEQSVQPGTCPSPMPAGDTSRTVQVGSVTRSYVLHIPPAYDGNEPVPLVVDFHGIGVTGWGELSSSPYPAVTDPEGVLMAFPDGMTGPIGTAWNMGPCCVADVDDFAFARALVADIESIACIDPDRIYAVGVLTGGGMVHHLACHAADVFAAVAPAAFDLLEETVDHCRPSRPITVISFRGTADARVAYEGGYSSLVPGMPITFLGAEATFERWARIDGCTGGPSEADSNGCSSYSGCPAGVEVILCTEEGGAEEPGDAEVAWPVLRRHSL
jgi:polyhydroxybutyrate depolymerase